MDKAGKKRRYLSFFLLAAFLLGAVLFAWIALRSKAEDVRFHNEKALETDFTWEAAYQGKSRPVALPARIRAKAGETVTFSTNLAGDGSYRNSLMLRATHQYIKVYLNNTLYGSFGKKENFTGRSTPGNGWVIVRLPENWEGQTLKIEVTGYYDSYAGALGKVYLGTKNALVFMVMRQCLPVIIFNFCIILISLLLLGASLFFKRSGMIYQLRYLSLFAFVTSIWLLLESGGYQLFWGNSSLVFHLIFILFSLVPVSGLRFLLTYESFEKSGYMNALYYLSVFYFVLIHALQITGRCDYMKSIAGIHVILVGIVSGIVLRLVSSLIHRRPVRDKSLYVSCLVFAAFGCVDILRFYLGNPAGNSVIFSQAGMSVFFLLLGSFGIKKVVEDNEKGIRQDFLKDMAYTDFLTSLPNRNAFEQELQYYRDGEGSGAHPLIVVADLNNLKAINDSLGHTKGDEAIAFTGQKLLGQFHADSRVFRIGGDEFCVIAKDLPKEEAERRLASFEREIREGAETKGFFLTVAAGCCKEEGEGIEAAFQKADSLMYQRKAEMKKIEAS